MATGGDFGFENGSARPSRVRYWIVFTATCMAVLLYLDRFCVSFAADYIREDLELSQKQIGWFFSAFFWSYALAQVPSGWLSDRYGARIMLAIYILSWSFFTAMIGAATSFVILLSARLLCGLGQAGAYPTSASIVSKWVPFQSRGTASSIIAFGGRLGGAVAPLLTAFLIVQFVPLSEDSRIQKSDILRGPQICDLLDESPSAIGEQSVKEESQRLAAQHLRSLLPADREVGALIEEGSRLQADYRREVKRRKDETKVPRPKLKKDDRRLLVETLNGLLGRNDLYDEEAFKGVNLARGTVRRLKAMSQGASVSDAQRQRTNRLLLEAVFSQALSKIYVGGWRPVMYVYGALGIIVAAMVGYLFRLRPETHPWCNEAEQELIAAGRPAHAPSPHGKAGTVPLLRLIKSRSMFFVCVMQWGTNVGWLFIVSWLPRYLLEVHNVPILERATMTMMPMLVGIVGMLCGGRLTDRLAHALGLKWGRRLPMMATRFTAALGYAGCLLFSLFEPGTGLNQPWFYVGALCLVAMSTDMGTAAIWAFKQDVGGRYVGSILGWGNMWGNLGAAVSPLIYDACLGETPSIAQWNLMFGVCFGAFVLAGLCAFGVDATIPIAPPDEQES